MSRCGAPTSAVSPCAAFAIASTSRRAARRKPGRSRRSSGGYPVTTSSGKRTTSTPASRASSILATTRSRLPPRSPTTLLIWASASLISSFRLSVENFSSHGPPPGEVEGDAGDEERERQPSDQRRVRLLPDDADDRRGDEREDQDRAQAVRAHATSLRNASSTARATAAWPSASR